MRKKKAAKKKKGSDIERSLDAEMEELLPAEEELEIFGRVLEPLGKGHFRVECADGAIRVCRVRGKLRGRRSWISTMPGSLRKRPGMDHGKFRKQRRG